MKIFALFSGLIITAGAFAATPELVSSSCEIISVTHSTHPGWSYSTSASQPKTSQLSLDFSRVPSNPFVGDDSGARSVYVRYKAFLRCYGTPDDIEPMVTWNAYRKCQVSAAASGPSGSYSEIQTFSMPFLAYASGGIFYDEEGTPISSGARQFELEGVPTAPCPLVEVSPGVWEGYAYQDYTSTGFAWAMVWPTSMGGIYVRQVDGMIQRKLTVTHINGVAVP